LAVAAHALPHAPQCCADWRLSQPLAGLPSQSAEPALQVYTQAPAAQATVAPERAAHGVVTVAPLSLQVTTEGAPGAQVGAAVGVHIQVEQGAPPAAPVQVAPAGQVTVLSERPSAAHRRTVVDVAQVALDGVQTVRRHASLTHTSPLAQAVGVQVNLSAAHTSRTVADAQRAPPGEQVTAQRPALHTSPPVQGASSQPAPVAAQRSTEEPLHRVAPGAHTIGAHAESMHTWPVGQAVSA